MKLGSKTVLLVIVMLLIGISGALLRSFTKNTKEGGPEGEPFSYTVIRRENDQPPGSILEDSRRFGVGAHDVLKQQEALPPPAVGLGQADTVLSESRFKIFFEPNEGVSHFQGTPKQSPSQATNLALEPDDAEYSSQLSDEEYFSRFYPSSYRAYLNILQDFMVREGSLEPKDKVVPTAERDMYAILLKTADHMFKQGYLSREEWGNLQYGFSVALPKLNKEERPLNEQRLLMSFDPASLLRYMLSLLVKKAYAFEVTVGACYRAVPSASPGFNSGAPCCNCGLLCTPKGCVNVPDCGPAGAACNTHFGCLNGVCFGGLPAIWDPTTGICGCG